MKIIPLSEGSFTIDRSKLFVPFDEEKEDLQSRPAGSLLVEVQPFIIITEKDVLLLDTGLGFADNTGTMQLRKNVEAAGIKAGDITKVLLSHLHKDHAGGIAEYTDKSRLCFPAATYYIREDELNFALEKGIPSFLPDELAALKNNPAVEFITTDAGYINDYIEFKKTGAHSPCHQVFWIRENKETIFFGADDAPQLQQMKHRFVAKYDYDGKKAMELRKEWWEKGAEEEWTFLFYHDISSPSFRRSVGS